MSTPRKIYVDLKDDRLTFIDEGKNDAVCKHSIGSDKDTFTWCTNTSGRLTLEWPNGDPFNQTPSIPLNGPGCMQAVQVTNTAPGSYKYNVILTDVNGVDHGVDPKVIIDSGRPIFTIWLPLAVIAGFGIGFLAGRVWDADS